MPLTCDSTDDLGLSPEFLADEDIARDEDDYGRPRRCTCGRDAAYQDPYREFDYHDFSGCRGCDPVDHECRPHRFGVETWEDHGRMACFRGCHAALSMGLISDATYQDWLARATTIDLRLAGRLDRAWNAICDASETHRQAIETYTRWLKRLGYAKHPR